MSSITIRPYLIPAAAAVLLLPPIFLATTYNLLATFPAPRPWRPTSNSLAVVKEERLKDVYPEDLFEGGAYVDLPQGRTRYWLFGPEDGKKMVLIHGLSVPSIMWKHVAPELARKGMRVLVYDLYGRGYTDGPEPPTQYTTGLYTTQLALLMQHVRWDEGADVIVGLSMGGAITSAFVPHFPDLAGQKIVLLSSVGVLTADHFSKKMRFRMSPFMQSALSIGFIRSALSPSPSLAKKDPRTIHDDVAELGQIQSTHLPQFNRAIASSLRDGPVRGLDSVFLHSSAWKDRDVLVIHGTEDEDVPYEYTTTIFTTALRDKARSVKLVSVEKGDHDLTLSRPDVVISALSGFLEL